MSRDRVTRGQWPPAVGDLVIRTLVSTEPCPPGWTEWRDERGQRAAWKVWTGPGTITGDPDAVWAVRPRGEVDGEGTVMCPMCGPAPCRHLP